jgi:hypothetical protein
MVLRDGLTLARPGQMMIRTCAERPSPPAKTRASGPGASCILGAVASLETSEEVNDDLPRPLDPRFWLETGARVIEQGLPELPAALNHRMSIPIAYWSGECCAVVTFMQFRSDRDGVGWAATCTVPFARQGSHWNPPQNHAYLWSSYAFDPVTDPGFDGHMDGYAMTYGDLLQSDHEPGQPANTALGHVSPAVRYLAVIQDDRQDYRPLHSHFGAGSYAPSNPAASMSRRSTTRASCLAALSTRSR